MRPLTTTTDENVTYVRELLNSDCRLSVRLVANIKYFKEYRSRDCGEQFADMGTMCEANTQGVTGK